MRVTFLWAPLSLSLLDCLAHPLQHTPFRFSFFGSASLG